ncbi:MAG: gliding motility-associated C-terminal domain-containing protein [Bacteroidales bacterium]
MQGKYFRLLILLAVIFNSVQVSAFFDGLRTYVDPEIEACPDEDLLVPVYYLSDYQYSVDSFNLVLNYDPAVLKYDAYLNVQASLLSFGIFEVNEAAGSITITYKSSDIPVKIASGALVTLRFKALSGSTDLNWFEPECIYYMPDHSPNMVYENGTVEVLPPMYFRIVQIPEEICPTDTASVYVSVTGGTPPYTKYEWKGPSLLPLSDTIARNLIAYQDYTLIVTDSKGCKHDTTFTVKTHPLNNVNITAYPDTVFISNPNITFSVENLSDPAIINYFWRFGDGDSINTPNPEVPHFYYSAQEFAKQGANDYEIKLTITNEYGCDTTFEYKLLLMEAPVFVPNVFTPNGDGANDEFKIVMKDNKTKVIDYEYLRLELTVVNRWGKKVYSSDNYKSDWDGGNVPDGVYFYVLRAIGYYKIETYKGSVHVLR